MISATNSVMMKAAEGVDGLPESPRRRLGCSGGDQGATEAHGTRRREGLPWILTPRGYLVVLCVRLRAVRGAAAMGGGGAWCGLVLSFSRLG